jgi:phosphoglycolate phosphatase
MNSYQTDLSKTDSYIFDVDGTIWDSTAAVAKSWRAVCQREGVPFDHITPPRLKQEFGKLLRDIGLSLFPSLSKEEADRITRLCCEEENHYLLDHGPEPYPGIRELFQRLSQSHPLFIVSNCQAGYIEVMLKSTGLGIYVTDHLCPGDTGEVKAANIRRIVDRHGLHTPVYIGDTLGDYKAAKGAGLPFIFASYGFGQVPNPDGVIKEPLDLLPS